ncbi:MAG TPA: CbiX/SirB N-terminal domain-containing protein [Verrucomicrobiota bacterium]|nr:cobalamin biosynthesis protein CbiX [Verrucomicrobiales bacterium]HRI12113.1 CbiX/SirB N-terminal domain-containing protein [Verrucomicrobiota bacterium]
MSDDFSDAALVLVGHGSTLNADSAAPTRQHAAELRRQGLFAQVVTAFWKEHPTLAGALRQAFTPRVFVVPLFISEGYFTEEVIPRELGLRRDGDATFSRIQRLGNQRVYYCGPVGTHPSMTGIILARAAEVVRQFPDSQGRVPVSASTTLFVAGHGTANNENSRKAIEQQVERIRGLGQFAAVHPLFMEEEPRIAECYQLAKTDDLVVVPFFISDGLHSYEDIPVMLGAPESQVQARFKAGQPTWLNPTTLNRKQVWYSPSIGREPHLTDVILERVRESAGSTDPSLD